MKKQYGKDWKEVYYATIRKSSRLKVRNENKTTNRK